MRIKLSDHLSLMLTEQGFTYSNWLYIDDDIVAVVEAGIDKQGLQGIDPRRVEMVLNSHHHPDHTRGNRLFENANVFIHENEVSVLQNAELNFYHNSMDQWDDLMPGSELLQATLALHLDEQDQPYNHHLPISSLQEGQTLSFGHTQAEVLYTPGHSSGHCCFWFPREEFLLSGDICLTTAGPWYGEHGADPDSMIRSIDRIIALNPPRLASSHVKELVEDPIPRLEEFKQRIEKREERIYDYLRRQPVDLHQLAAAHLIYRAHPTDFVLFWEKLMLLKHLGRLMQQGRVRQQGEIYYVA